MRQGETSVGTLGPLLVSTWFFFTVGVSLPANIYLNNAPEFTVNLSDFWVVAIPALLVCATVSASIVRYVRLARNERVVAVLFAITLAAWVQGNLLLWQYGPLDGRPIAWQAHQDKGLIDGAMWVLLLTLALVKPRPFFRSSVIVPGLIITMETITLAFSAVTAGSDDGPGSIKRFVIDESSKFMLSKHQNVLIFVLDELQSDVFSDVISANGEYARIFEGFTYFPDAVAGSNYTELAIPALLTGRLYDNSEPKEQFLKTSFLEHSVFALVADADFHVDVFPWVGWGNESIYFDEALADNFRTVDADTAGSTSRFTEKKAKELIHLVDLSLFRCAPHFVKRYIYNDQRWFLIEVLTALVPSEVKQSVSTDNEFETSVFSEAFNQKFELNDSPRSFKYYHLKGAHKPLTVRTDLSVGKDALPYTRDNYVLQIKASLKGVERVLRQLKETEIFDDSLIFVLGDHGSGEIPEMYVGPSSEFDPQDKMADRQHLRNFRRDKARGIPLFLVKRFDARGPIYRSDTPVSSMDLEATVAGELNVEKKSNGLSAFAATDRSARRRFYGAFDFTANKASFVGPITLYSVTGNSWIDTSWSAQKILLPPEGTE